MPAPNLNQIKFLDRIIISSFPGEVAKRFGFADGEVAAVYTLSHRARAHLAQPVVLYVATFPPSQQPGLHDFGIDYYEQPVASATEAAQLLAAFDREQAALFRVSCRVT